MRASTSLADGKRSSEDDRNSEHDRRHAPARVWILARAHLEHGPTPVRRNAAKLAIRVDRNRMPDKPEKRQIGGAVRVGRALGEIKTLLRRELADGTRLGVVMQGMDGVTGVHAVSHLAGRPQGAVEVELLRERFDDLLQRGGNDVDALAP